MGGVGRRSPPPPPDALQPERACKHNAQAAGPGSLRALVLSVWLSIASAGPGCRSAAGGTRAVCRQPPNSRASRACRCTRPACPRRAVGRTTQSRTRNEPSPAGIGRA
eukprot:scaffold7504_cov121-Isochrysis_galbana.AAC.12